jgi:cell division protein FtsZ
LISSGQKSMNFARGSVSSASVGAGGNAIANMIKSDVQGVQFLVANTDAQALNASEADARIQLGLKITQGLGAGSRPEIGRAAAEETIDEIEKGA